MRSRVILAAFMIFACFDGISQAAEDPSDSTPECNVIASKLGLIVLVCPEGLTDTELQAAGQRACGPTMWLCNAWIWDDVAAAPADVPLGNNNLDEDAVRQAVAVWVNDAQSLIKIRKVSD